MSDLEAPRRPRQNRVTPFGELESTEAKGLFLGNRGDLLNKKGELARRFKQKFWITCTLEEVFGRKVPLDRPGYYTPLFFLDEVTALAAGHRPCAMCRRKDYLRFRTCFANTGLVEHKAVPSAPQIDACLHPSRITEDRQKVTYRTSLASLPDGVIYQSEEGDEPRLKWKQMSWRWTHFGYDNPRQMIDQMEVAVLTPKPIVQVLAAGYEPVVHISANV